MLTPLKFNQNLLLSSFPSHLCTKNPQNDAVSIIHLRMFRLRGFNLLLNHHHHRHHHHHRNSNLQILKPDFIFARKSSMADTQEAERSEKQNPLPLPLAAEKTAAKEKEKEKKELPPPPEKPEAGDCCGSGCVRCVWDIYYEELDAYDQLLKDFNNSPN
ncbi:uncharacterized protein [Spinacia oleracea]|uniref:Oxidoreductase-like domain-containing protein n=1 Tax=Spinacia oleracea TaxID=3562 RepID=A0ABM3RN00_SPIOL|nr:uncharacterized protein LOC130470594 [Spinacia oleracea]